MANANEAQLCRKKRLLLVVPRGRLLFDAARLYGHRPALSKDALQGLPVDWSRVGDSEDLSEPG